MERTRNSESSVGRSQLRLVGDGDVGKGVTPDLLDLSIDSSESPTLLRGRLVAWVDVRLEGTTVPHGGLCNYVKQHLAGRNPVVFEEEGYLRTGFAVEDHGATTMGRLGVFADQLRELLHSGDVVLTPATLPGERGTSFYGDDRPLQ